MLSSVGLGGDGDEITAIENAFARFGVEVPVEDAANWATVGDVWASLCRLAPKAPTQPMAFLRFCSALCDETGIDPKQIDGSSRLLA